MRAFSFAGDAGDCGCGFIPHAKFGSAKMYIGSETSPADTRITRKAISGLQIVAGRCG